MSGIKLVLDILRTRDLVEYPVRTQCLSKANCFQKDQNPEKQKNTHTLYIFICVSVEFNQETRFTMELIMSCIPSGFSCDSVESMYMLSLERI